MRLFINQQNYMCSHYKPQLGLDRLIHEPSRHDRYQVYLFQSWKDFRLILILTIASCATNTKVSEVMALFIDPTGNVIVTDFFY